MQKPNATRLIFLFVTTTFMQPIQGVAEDYTSIIKKKEYEIFVDIDSYGQQNNLPFITAKTVYSKPQLRSKTLTKKTFLKHVTQLQFDCKNPLYRLRLSHYLDQKNKIIDQDSSMQSFQAIPAGSDIFSIGQLTCQVHQMVGGQ
jgi:hypothetical protein